MPVAFLRNKYEANIQRTDCVVCMKLSLHLWFLLNKRPIYIMGGEMTNDERMDDWEMNDGWMIDDG